MWRVHEKPKVLQVTRALAERFAEMPTYRDRPLQPWRKDWIKTEARKNTRTFVWAYAICGGKEYRVNGKHSSNAFVEMFQDGNAPEASALIESFVCDSIEDVASLFATYDSKKSARSTSDINRIFSSASPVLEKMNCRILDLCVTGLSTDLWGKDLCHHSCEDRAQLMLAHVGFCEFMSELLDKASESAHLRRGPVAAAIARTFRKDAKRARVFWLEVRDGTGKDPKKSPTRVLQRYLLTVSIKSKGTKNKQGEMRRNVDPEAVLGLCMDAWHAYKDNEVFTAHWRKGSKIRAA